MKLRRLEWALNQTPTTARLARQPRRKPGIRQARYLYDVEYWQGSLVPMKWKWSIKP